MTAAKKNHIPLAIIPDSGIVSIVSNEADDYQTNIMIIHADISDSGSACQFTFDNATGKIINIINDGMMPVKELVADATLTGSPEAIKASLEKAWGQDYVAELCEHDEDSIYPPQKLA